MIDPSEGATPPGPWKPSADELRELQALGRRRRFPGGTSLFGEGDRSDWVALIVNGRVKASFHTRDGREVILAIRSSGDLIGELSAIDGEPRSATVVAIDPVDALVVPAKDFLHFLQDRPSTMLRLLRTVALRLRDADRKRVEYGAADTVGRIASRLVELADRFGEPEGEGVRITIPLTQEQLAAWAGCSREAATKALQLLRARGLIETRRRAIVLLDPPAVRLRAI